MPARIPDKTRRGIVRDARKYSAADVADMHAVIVQTVYRVVRESARPAAPEPARRNGRVDGRTKAAIVRARAKGESAPSIAARFGVSYQTVYNYAREAGL